MRRFLKLALALSILACAVFAARFVMPARGNVNFRNEVSIEVHGEFREIHSNGIPKHQPGQFPNRGNPNTIRPQRYEFRVPAKPKVAAKTTPFELGKFGVAVNGVPFDPGAAEFWHRDFRSGWQYEALSGKINLGLDEHNAHVQPNGAYHYHGVPTGLLKQLEGGAGKITLLGYAADGFPIFAPYGYSDPQNAESEIRPLKSSFQLRKGTRPDGREDPGGKFDGTFVADYEYVPGSGDLDECNGRTGVMPGYSDGTYYYVLTYEFPFIPRAFRGTPDRSFLLHGPPGKGPPGKGPPPKGFPPPPFPPPPFPPPPRR